MSNRSDIPKGNNQPNHRVAWDFRPFVLLGSILLLALGLRIYNLGTESYWIDEIATVFEAKQSVPQLLSTGRLDQPLGYYLPFRIWMQTFGTTEAATRTFSVLAGIGSIFLTYLIGRELFNHETGLIGAFLMTISAFQIHYSQETRNYMFFEFTTILSFFFFILALKKQRVMYYAAYLAASVLMIFSNIFGVLTLVAQGFYFVIQIKKFRNQVLPWLICQILLIIAILPYHYPLLFESSGLGGAIALNIPGIPKPSAGSLLRTYYRFVLPPRRDMSWNVILIYYAIAGAVFVIGLWINNFKKGVKGAFSDLVGIFNNLKGIPNLISKIFLLFCWLLFPVVPLFVYSIIGTPMYRDYYTIGAAPALYLLLALGIFIIKKVLPVFVMLLVIAVMVIPGLTYYYTTDVKQQWDEAARYVKADAKEGELIVFAPNWGNVIQQKSFDWYYPGAFQACGLGDVNGLIDPGDIKRDLTQCVSGYDRFWVIVSDQNEGTGPFAVFFHNPDPTFIKLIKTRQFTGDITAFLFEFEE